MKFTKATVLIVMVPLMGSMSAPANAETTRCEDNVIVVAVYQNSVGFNNTSRIGIRIRTSGGTTRKYSTENSGTSLNEDVGKAMLQMALVAYTSGQPVDIYRNSDRCQTSGIKPGGFIDKWNGIKLDQN